MNWEALRARYKPNQVTVLLVGESPPAGETYFFAGNSKLFLATQNAFKRFLGRSFKNPEAFLRFFSEQGFFLEDLCSLPVNRLANSDRRRLRREAIPSLASRLKSTEPSAVVVVMKGIKKQVTSAMAAAELHGVPSFTLPFPAFGHTGEYEAELYSALCSLHERGIIRSSANKLLQSTRSPERRR